MKLTAEHLCLAEADEHGRSKLHPSRHLTGACLHVATYIYDRS